MTTLVVIEEFAEGVPNELYQAAFESWASRIIYVPCHNIAYFSPRKPPTVISTDEGERDDALSRILGLICSPSQRIREQLR